MPNLEQAIQWAIRIANDDSHGYDQVHRNGPDYDCSSFVSTALKIGGFNISESCTTRNLRSALLNCGWRIIPLSDARKRGDIFLSEGHHVVLCTSPTQIVHASINEKGTTTGGKTGDQTGTEICVRSFYNHPKGWTHHFRYNGGLTGSSQLVEYDWIYKKNYYQMTQAEMDNNAIVIYIYLAMTYGWSINAIAGLCGNCHVESLMQPNAFEGNNYDNYSVGFGLVQWTPGRNYINWVGVGRHMNNGYSQLDRLNYEIERKIEYYKTSSYPTPATFAEFAVSELEPGYLAKAFIYNYERPASYSTAERRAEMARHYYELFLTIDLSAIGKKRWPLWAYLKYGL